MSYFAKDKELNLLHPESQKIFRRLIESVQNGIYMADGKGNIFYANHALAAMLGYESKEDILGLNLIEELCPNAQDREDFFEHMDKKGHVYDYEIRTFKKDKTPVVFLATIDPIRNEKGDVIGTEGILLDITEKQQLEEDLKTEKSKLEQILEFNERIGTIRKQDELVRYIVEKASQILSADKCSLMLFDNDSRELHIESAKGISDDIVAVTKIKLGEQIAGHVAQSEEALLVKNIDYDKRFKRHEKSSYVSRSFMSASIRREHKLIGVLNVTDKNSAVQGTFNELDLKILSTIVRQAAVAIDNAKLYHDLEYLSSTDPLTDLFNYRTFVKKLDYEISRLKRYSGTLSLLMIDIDNFKFINDTYGHLQGDDLLRKVSAIFQENLRDLDTICRYGGDEFAVILPGTNSEQARIVAEKLREKVEGYSFKEKLSLSIGIAQYHPGSNRYDLTQRADQALYKAKKMGKNRIATDVS